MTLQASVHNGNVRLDDSRSNFVELHTPDSARSLARELEDAAQKAEAELRPGYFYYSDVPPWHVFYVESYNSVWKLSGRDGPKSGSPGYWRNEGYALKPLMTQTLGFHLGATRSC